MGFSSSVRLHLLQQFVISSSVPNESGIKGGMGNPGSVFCILLLCPEIPGSSGEGKNEE